MKGYDLLKQWERLTNSQRKHAIGYFLGGVGMHFDGFRDDHKDKPHAEYALSEFENAIRAIEFNPEKYPPHEDDDMGNAPMHGPIRRKDMSDEEWARMIESHRSYLKEIQADNERKASIVVAAVAIIYIVALAIAVALVLTMNP